MRVLVGFEESQVVAGAFRQAGHDAWSCDTKETRGDKGCHLKGDIMGQLSPGWDLIILHPPCTSLALSGNGSYAFGKPSHSERLASIEWTLNLWRVATCVCERVVLENPSSVIFPHLRRAGVLVQYIQPWQFGHGGGGGVKRTGFALKGVPPLVATAVVTGREARVHRMPPSPTRARDRSVTYQGVADAMASQWGLLEPTTKL